jgi:hypothetical protein
LLAQRAVHARDEEAIERRLRSNTNEEDEKPELSFEEATGGTRDGRNRKASEYMVSCPRFSILCLK